MALFYVRGQDSIFLPLGRLTQKLRSVDLWAKLPDRKWAGDLS